MHRHGNCDFVCAECFADDGLRAFVEAHAENNECDFCGAVGEEPIAAPFDEVADHIFACIGKFYDDPANAGLPYETAEGGWQGETYTTPEIFAEVELDFPNTGGDRLMDAVEGASPIDLWCEAEPFQLTQDQRLKFSWDEFCRIIKHQCRYFFLQTTRDYDDHDDLYSPSAILELIFSYAQRADAFITIPDGTSFFRARFEPHGQNFTSAAELGPPPEELSNQTNRMSPPGIVMTYTADDPTTALAETASAPGMFAIGEFVIERDALLLDLTNLPEVPSLFTEVPDSMEYDPRPLLAFLHGISREISRPIARDDRVHVEYVPTQVVTEYVRTAVKIGQRSVDGIRYTSSHSNAGTAVVLFVDRRQLILEEREQPEYYGLYRDRWLRLRKVTKNTVSKRDITGWTAPASNKSFRDRS